MSDARTILVAGTASHVGKSTVAAGLCRLLADRGVDVVPFKAQNMSNNARAVPRAGAVDDGGSTGDVSPPDAGAPDESPPDAGAFGEIGVSQYVQARAARVPATTDHNPVLLKPRGDGESQLVVDGLAVGHLAAGEYYGTHWADARAAAEAAHARLAAVHDVIVAEGAGSIAEINLQHRDLANLETARFADRVASETRREGRAAESYERTPFSRDDGRRTAPSGPPRVEILLVADIERGGVFASLVGTLELLPDDVRERVAGAVITKFRGDRSILDPGLEEFEDRTGVPVLGVLPYDDPGLPEEDSVALPAAGETGVLGADDGVDADRTVTVAVPRFPRASNVTDVEPLARVPGVRVRFVPLDASLQGSDAALLTGTKNTVDDALAARDAGLYEELRAFDGPVVGLCGGYQLLGERLEDADVEGTGDAESVPGVGLLPVETRFSPEKTVEPVERELDGVGPLAGVSGRVAGYEIHMGDSRLLEEVYRPFPGEGAVVGDVLGTYLHGLFENEVAREGFVEHVFEAAGLERPEVEGDGCVGSPYDRAADLVSEIDLEPLGL